MTPLAHRIVKELTLPLRKRTFDDRGKLLTNMDDIHCFEITACLKLAEELAVQIFRQGFVFGVESTFLPAPKTWIEFQNNFGRFGMLLIENNPKDGWASITHANESNFASSAKFGMIKLVEGKPYIGGVFDGAERPEIDAVILALLAMINTPRIIGRRQHMPHRGLERKLVAARPMVGKFPLHAWTEIKLQVTPPQDMSGEASTEAHLTGERALHFCRAHIRIRLGRLEVVRGHWRGDPSLGIRRSRYKVTA